MATAAQRAKAIVDALTNTDTPLGKVTRAVEANNGLTAAQNATATNVEKAHTSATATVTGYGSRITAGQSNSAPFGDWSNLIIGPTPTTPAPTNTACLLIGTSTQPAGVWSVYNASTNPSAFAGKLSLGSTISPITAPSGVLEASGSGSGANIFFTGYDINSSLLLRRANGTEAAPTALLSEQNIGVVGARGYGATGFSSSSRANIRFVTAENWTDSAQGAYFSINTTPIGSATSAERLRITDSGELSVITVGKGISIKEGSNARMGVATLVAGTVTVSNTAVTASSRIFLTTNTPGGTVGAPYISARSAGVSFTITSTNVADTSTVAWEIKEPA